ncbi:uncharacterized protein UTRI_03797_B [Ustilago trichophora]|uniref:Uncharacterized protein n=1 Tax=Ustilago trichophora TaxID=86804 RepID=A0A5C3E2E8_9BASI|nr:uncharacterized protein UTRI_03797_B [Ustilago trichophora]
MSMPTPTTPGPGSSPSKLRICKKLVVKGHASSSGASYTLFLKVQLPASEHDESYTLLTDPAVELQDAVVHKLDPSGAAPALSASAATAASSLGIPLSIDNELNDSFIDFKPGRTRQRRASVSNDHSHLPAVVRGDDGKVMLRSSARSSPRPQNATASQVSGTSYMVTLHLFAAVTSAPPTAPFSVRLAVPFCLNNFMGFTVDESMEAEPGMDGITVEVDPPILPVSSQRRSPRRRSSAASSHRAHSIASHSDDDEADVTLLGSASVDDSGAEQDDTSIVGPFQACEALVIRIAAQQAGDLVLPGPPFRVLPNALRAKKARSSIAYRPRTSEESAGEIDFEANIQLEGLFFPGLDREVLLYVQLDPETSVADWQPVAVDASRGILSWSYSPVMSERSSPAQQPTTASENLLRRSPTFEIGDLVVLPEPNQHGAEEEDLLKTAPPKGINDADFDFSLDNVAAPPVKQRRFSLQSSSSSKPIPSQPLSELSEPGSAPSKVLMLAFTLLPILQSNEPITISVRGTISSDNMLASTTPYLKLDQLPKGLFVPAALAHEYTQPSLAPIETRSLQLHSADQQRESLEDSRETVQQQQEKQGLSLQSPKPNGDANIDDILRQALAIIAAHNESLSDPNGRLVLASAQASQTRRGEKKIGSGWVLRASHLLWTLFLTAMIFVLFNASQNANRALSAKLDELSRIVEASARQNAQTAQSKSDIEEVKGVFSSVLPIASSVPSKPVVESEPRTVLDTFEPSHTDSFYTSDQLAEASALRPDDVSQHEAQLQPDAAGADLAHFVSTWLQDLLSMPVLLIRRLFSILTGA